MCGNVVMVAPRISLVRNNENCADEILYGDECWSACGHDTFPSHEINKIQYFMYIIQFKLNEMYLVHIFDPSINTYISSSMYK